MRGLPALIRLRRRELDERRRHLAELEDMRRTLIESKAALEAELERERAFVRDKEKAQPYFATFAQAQSARRVTIDRSIAELDLKIEAARAEIQSAFRELKKFEIAKAKYDERLSREAARLAQEELDGIALDMFRRQGMR